MTRASEGAKTAVFERPPLVPAVAGPPPAAPAVRTAADEAEELDQILSRVREFTQRLRRENDRLRARIAGLEASGGGRVGEGDGVASRVRDVEERLAESEAANRKLAAESKELTDDYLKMEEQNNNLGNLFVASCQLHSTLDYAEAVRIVQDIVINLIGAECFHLLTVNEKTGRLEVEASEGQEPSRRSITPGEGLIGRAVQTGQSYFAGTVVSPTATPFEEPIAVIPLRIKSSVIGAISINKLLVQKTVFTATDHELFTLLGGHAASALLAARLYSTSQRKLSTLQGFVEILKVNAPAWGALALLACRSAGGL
jgi:hypothetical protein